LTHSLAGAISEKASDAETLPDLSTCYLVTNLPAPAQQQATLALFAQASLEEVIRLYGLGKSG
jgi:hypothetical protein